MKNTKNMKNLKNLKNLYIGVMPFTIEAINPNDQILSSIYGYEKKAPEYKGIDNNNIEYSIITIILKGHIKEEQKPIFALNFRIYDYYVESLSKRYQVIDEYCRTAWLTPKEAEAKIVPMYKNGMLKVTSDYTRVPGGDYIELVKFIRAFYDLQDPGKLIDGKWVENENKGLCGFTFQDMKSLMKGDTKELHQLLDIPENKVKCMIGIKKAEKPYNILFKSAFESGKTTDYEKIEDSLRVYKEIYPTSDILYSTEDYSILKY